MTELVTIEKGLGPDGRVAVVRFDRPLDLVDQPRDHRPEDGGQVDQPTARFVSVSFTSDVASSRRVLHVASWSGRRLWA